MLYEGLGKNVTGLGENLFMLMKNSFAILGSSTHIAIFIYICTLMTIEKINDMRSRVAGIRRFL